MPTTKPAISLAEGLLREAERLAQPHEDPVERRESLELTEMLNTIHGIQGAHEAGDDSVARTAKRKMRAVAETW